jgi:hypothetical protein
MRLALDPDLAATAPSRGVTRAVGADMLAEATALVADAFGVAAVEAPPGTDVWLGCEDGHAVSCVIAAQERDQLAIWIVATPAGLRGAGRASGLLRALLGHYALEGLATAHVASPPASRSLFARLGFSAG